MQKDSRRTGILLIMALLCTIAAPAEPARKVTVLFTHDLHSRFRPHKTHDTLYNSNDEGVYAGGYARLAAAIAAARAAESPYTPTVLVDAGDFSGGSAFHSLFTTDCAELQLMALMGYDVATLGNHEFDAGIDGLTRALAAAQRSRLPVPAIVAANIAVDRNLAGSVREYTVLVRDDVRIGVFGLLGDNALEEAPLAAPLAVENRLTAARRMVQLLREQEQADVIICLSHSGTNSNDRHRSEDEQLAREVAGIDIIISGHSHTVLSQPLVVNRTVIASAGCFARYLGVLTRGVDTKTLYDYRLLPIDTTLTADRTLSAAIDSFARKLYRTMDDTVAISPFRLPCTADDSTGESLLGNLVADAFAAAAESALHIAPPIAVVPAGTLRNDLYKGYNTEEDIFSILSLGTGADGAAGYPLVCVYLYGKELTDLCEIDASFSASMPDAQLFFAGLRYAYDPHRILFTKVTQVWVAGKNGQYEQPADRTLYPVTASLYAAQMLGVVGQKTHGLLSLQPKDAHGNPVTDYTQHLLYLSKNKELKEWLALSNYLRTFSLNGQPAVLPEHYARPQGQKIVRSQPNLWLMFLHCLLFFGLLALIFAWRNKRRALKVTHNS